MTFKLIYKMVAWTTIPIFALLTAHSITGQMLCVDDDNHMQVESAGDSCCGLGVPRLSSNELVNQDEKQPGCGDCRDMDLNQVGSVRVFSRLTNLPVATAFAGLFWSGAATPFSNSIAKLSLWDNYLPAFTQPQLSVSIAILIC